jgi:hypothetical protein
MVVSVAHAPGAVRLSVNSKQTNVQCPFRFTETNTQATSSRKLPLGSQLAAHPQAQAQSARAALAEFSVCFYLSNFAEKVRLAAAACLQFTQQTTSKLAEQ